MDPSPYMSKELNLYSQDGTKRLHVKDNSGSFVFDYKDDVNGISSPISIINQHLIFESSDVALTDVLLGIKQSVTDETFARTTADEEIVLDLEDKYDRLSGAINRVNQSLGSYVASLSNTISSVNVQVSMDRNDRQNEDLELGARIDTEIYDRQQAVATVQQNLDSETYSRVQHIQALQGGLTDEINNRHTAIQGVEASVVTEAKLRSDADAVLQGQIIGLVAGGSASSVEYKQLIDDEYKRAFLAEANLAGSINQLSNQTTNSLTTEAKTRFDEDANIKASVETEVKRALEEEGKLSARLDFILHNTTAPALDSLSEIVSKFSTDGQGYADRLTYLEGVIMSLVNR